MAAHYYQSLIEIHCILHPEVFLMHIISSNTWVIGLLGLLETFHGWIVLATLTWLMTVRCIGNGNHER
jgi:hypothetical protein